MIYRYCGKMIDSESYVKTLENQIIYAHHLLEKYHAQEWEILPLREAVFDINQNRYCDKDKG